MTNNNNQKLVASIAEAVKVILNPAFETLAAQNGAEFTNLNSICSALLARVEVMEKIPPSTGGAKRAPRGERRTVASTEGDDPLYIKIKNAMLYTRRMWASKFEFRTKYLTEDVQAEFDGNTKTSKHPVDTEARWLAEGRLFWQKCASTPQKNDIRDEFTRWQEERKRDELAEQLDADDDANDSGPRE